MTQQEIENIIKKYDITDNGNGTIAARLPKGKKEADTARAEIMAAKDEIKAYFAEIKAAAEERRRKIEAIEGLGELRKARAEWDEYYYKREKAFDSERVIIPDKPKANIEDLNVKYPRAAAYLKAESYSCASNYAKAAAGRKAMERIINGEDHKVVIANMEAEWSAAAHEAAMWN